MLNWSNSPSGGSAIDRFAARRSNPVRAVSIITAIGLAFLYESGAFLPPLSQGGVYFLNFSDVLLSLLLPNLLIIVVLTLLILGMAAAVRRWAPQSLITMGAIPILAILCLVALKGLTVAAGYSWEDRIFRGHDLLATLQYFKVILFGVLLLVVFLTRAAIPRLTRGLASLGFAFAVLAMTQLFVLWNHSSAAMDPRSITALPMFRPQHSADAAQNPTSALVGDRTRRVVWVVFDETDFNRVFSSSSGNLSEFPHFKELAQRGVFASNANSPASATLYSVPALLMGVPISGAGVKIDKWGTLSVEQADGTLAPFDETTSIFGALAAGGHSAAILGFFHPYCKLFQVRRCDSFAWPPFAGLNAALWANIPGSVATALGRPDSWGAITEKSLSLLPDYLAGDDSLAFIHLNVPHLPAGYADKVQKLAKSANPLTEYEHNLRLTDKILGDIVQSLQAQIGRHDVLLVVSSDHWLRNRWYQANVPETERPIPLIMWKVGENSGIVVAQKLSTVNTAAMILDYLEGRISTQYDISQWWLGQPTTPTFIAPNT